MTPSERALLVAIGRNVAFGVNDPRDEVKLALVAVERERTEPHASHCSCGHAIERHGFRTHCYDCLCAGFERERTPAPVCECVDQTPEGNQCRACGGRLPAGKR